MLTDYQLRIGWLFYQIAAGTSMVFFTYRFFIFCSRIEGFVRQFLEKYHG